jgi:hypothetical protein
VHKKYQIKKTFWELSRIFTVHRINLFQDSNFPKSYLPPIRGSSWHKNEIKKIRRGHYSSNNFQDSTKRKITENKTLDYLPRVLFCNAFQLGAVIWEDAHISTRKELEVRESIKKQIWNTFKSNPLPMHRNLVRK